MSDNIYPTGINTTTGAPEVAATPYSSIAGDFVSLLDGSTVAAVQTIQKDGVATASLTVKNASTGGSAVYASTANASLGLESGVVIGVPISTLSASVNGGETFLYFTADGAAENTVTLSTLTGSQNNFDPGAVAFPKPIWFFSADAGGYSITGIRAPLLNTCKRLTLINTGANAVTLTHQSGSSSAANRFYFSTQSNVVLSAQSAVTIIYAASIPAWIDESANLSSGGNGSVSLDGDNFPSQEITGTTNNAVELEVTTSNTGNSSSALVGTNSTTASIAMVSYSSGYTDATRQSATEISSATGSNGLIIHNSTGDPIKFEIGAAERLRFNTQGWAPATDTQAITAVGDTITPTAPTMLLNPDGNYTLTSNPTIAAGTVIGQRVILTTAEGEANTVAISDNATDPGSNVFLYNADPVRTIGDHSISEFMWNGTSWIEMYYNAI